jgi:hypothetical protein
METKKNAAVSQKEIRKYLSVLEEKAYNLFRQDRQDQFESFLEKFKIDFGKLKEKISLFKDSEIEITDETLHAWSYQLWKESVPANLIHFLENPSDRDRRHTQKAIAFIEGLGIKYRALQSKLCVSRHFPPDCRRCYFKEVCAIKE